MKNIVITVQSVRRANAAMKQGRTLADFGLPAESVSALKRTFSSDELNKVFSKVADNRFSPKR